MPVFTLKAAVTARALEGCFRCVDLGHVALQLNPEEREQRNKTQEHWKGASAVWIWSTWHCSWIQKNKYIRALQWCFRCVVWAGVSSRTSDFQSWSRPKKWRLRKTDVTDVLLLLWIWTTLCNAQNLNSKYKSGLRPPGYRKKKRARRTQNKS